MAVRTERTPRFNHEHELPPAPPVVALRGRAAACSTIFVDELASGVGEHESLSELSIFKVDGMAFGDVFFLGRFPGLGLDYESPIEAIRAALALAALALLSWKDPFAGLFTNHGFVDEIGGDDSRRPTRFLRP